MPDSDTDTILETADRASRRMRGRVAVAAAAAVGLMAAAIIALAIAFIRPGEPVAATMLPEPLPLPAFSLTDAEGRAFTRESLRGGPHLLFFGFTNCPDVCPITLQQLATARRRLAGSGAGELPEIVFVSVDPERDSIESVRDYVQSFGDGVTGVRGELDEIDKLTGALGVFHARPAIDGGYAVEHSAAILFIDDEARFRAVFSAPHDVDDIVHDWPILIADRS